jgi:hypothetical protein
MIAGSKSGDALLDKWFKSIAPVELRYAVHGSNILREQYSS